MTNKTCTVVYGPWDRLFENRHKMRRTYGCVSILHMPGGTVEAEQLGPGLLAICEEKPDFSDVRFDFPVRVVTYKVAMEMVKIDEEGRA